MQGFGQRYIDAGGATLGTATIRANQVSRFITFSVPKASARPAGQRLGLHGGADRPGRLQPRPGAAASSRRRRTSSSASAPTASSDPHCTFAPSLVPKAVDVITPPGVAQSTELDYTLGPVVIKGVTIP